MIKPPEELLNELLENYYSGNLKLAEQQATILTSKFPEYPFGWKILGGIYHAIGRLNEALVAKKTAIRLDPGDYEAFSNLGVTFQCLGRFNEAEACYYEALKLKPDYPEAYCNLGVSLHGLGRLRDAEICFRRSIFLKNDFVEAYNNLGNTLKDLDRLQEAEGSYREAICLKPDYSEAHSNLGIVLQKSGKIFEAKKCFETAIAIKQDYIEAYINLGNTFKDLGQFEKAESIYRRAIQINPGHIETMNNLGNVLKELGKTQEAKNFFSEIVKAKPDFAEAHSNLGNVLKDLGRFKDAESSYREAIRLKPDYAEAHSNLGIVLADLGCLSEAVIHLTEAVRLRPDFIHAHSNLLFIRNYIDGKANELALNEAMSYGIKVSSLAMPKFTYWRKINKPNKLRIGFVSGDFRNHPVGYFLEGLLQNLDRSKFEIYAFPTSPKNDNFTDQLKSNFKKWIPIYGKSDFESAKIIHAQSIQVLVDLSGHTAHNRLPVFAYKPAPVQVSWLGYFATTGLQEMDYFMGDKYMSPISESKNFTEKILNLPNVWLSLKPPVHSPQINILPALENKYITFGCFGNLSKINDEVISVWAKILNINTNSKLYLKSRQLADPKIVLWLREKLYYYHNIIPERLIMEGASERYKYLESYQKVDIVLDTFPYPGGTTSVDALWMGVPVITLKGNRFLSRLGESIVTNAGHREWIANDIKEYISNTTILASDLQKLNETRQKLRNTLLKTPLLDTVSFAKDFENIILEISHNSIM